MKLIVCDPWTRSLRWHECQDYTEYVGTVLDRPVILGSLPGGDRGTVPKDLMMLYSPMARLSERNHHWWWLEAIGDLYVGPAVFARQVTTSTEDHRLRSAIDADMAVLQDNVLFFADHNEARSFLRARAEE